MNKMLALTILKCVMTTLWIVGASGYSIYAMEENEYTEKVSLSVQQARSILETFEKMHPLGGTLALGRDDKILTTSSQGMCSLETSCTQATRYPIGSLTKQFTAVALLKAVLQHLCKGDAQKLSTSLDQPVITILQENDPFWPDGQAPKWAWTITLHHLLSNTSGLKDVDTTEYIEFGKMPRSRAEVSKLYIDKNHTLSFEPGEKYEYSNPNFFFAGIIVERLSGKTLGNYMKDEIFIPNNMLDTFLLEDNIEESFDKDPLLARGFMYSLKEKGDIYPSTSYFSSTLNQGDGGLISTVADLAKWNNTLWETNDILPDEAKQIMLFPKQIHQDQTHYGYGIEVEKNDDRTIYSHEGLVPGYRSVMFYDPKTKLSLIQLSNISQDLDQWIDIMNQQSEIQSLEEPEKTQKDQILKRTYPIAEELYNARALISSELFSKIVSVFDSHT